MVQSTPTKGIIYYSDNRTKAPFIDMAREYIQKSGLPIVSCTLNSPLDFGENYVHMGNRSYPTMVQQIIIALEHLKTDYVFFCEHDVLYHPSHWEFTPGVDDNYFYNVNNWRWRFADGYAITYEWVCSLSQLCCNREMALEHFQKRLETAKKLDYDFNRSREPRWARRWGYEPGTKPTSRGGFSDEHYGIWWSKQPNVDIRHSHTLSVPKTTLEEFRHPPKGLKQIPIEKVPGWDWNTILPILQPCEPQSLQEQGVSSEATLSNS